jgi:predicted RNase H-like HicB family nuclease
MRKMKVIVEEHINGFVAYPVGLKGIVVGQGDTYQEVLEDIRSAICFHVETFGYETLEEGTSMLDAYVVETEVPI